MDHVNALSVELLIQAIRSAAIYEDRERLFAVLNAAEEWVRAKEPEEEFRLWQYVAAAAGWRKPNGG